MFGTGAAAGGGRPDGNLVFIAGRRTTILRSGLSTAPRRDPPPRLRRRAAAAARRAAARPSSALRRRGCRGRRFAGRRQGAFRGTTAKGTVTSVRHRAAYRRRCTIAIAKLPTGVTAKYVGMARIKAGCSPATCCSCPRRRSRAAVTTPQSRWSPTARPRHEGGRGQQTRAESEIISGLSVGDNVVYKRTGTEHTGRRRRCRAGRGTRAAASRGPSPATTRNSCRIRRRKGHEENESRDDE